MEYTGGEWKYNIDSGRVESGKVIICSIRAMMSDTGYANARLIAAAPDLLKALQDMMKKYGGMYDEWQEVDLRARDAIIKATEIKQ